MIHFVGAGPGAPDLITLRGAELLKQADVCIYAGSLVNPVLLGLCREDCAIYNSAEMTLEEVLAVMEQAEAKGKQTVRLHTGDPCLYGAIREQMDALDSKGISYAITPGVSSFCGAAAAAEAEYTLPGVSQTVIITRMEGRTPVPEGERLASLAVGDRLMCVFVDTGLFRQGESENVISTFMDSLGLVVAHVDASEAFLRALSGVRSRDDKERIAAQLMTQVLIKQLGYDPGIRAIVLGANLNDALFGFSTSAELESVKSAYNLCVCEPVRDLFKEEVRRLATALSLPDSIALRQPFPASGLALRIFGQVTPERLAVLRAADACFSEEIREGGYAKRLWQYYTNLVDSPDQPGAYAVSLRALQVSQGGAMAARLAFDVLERASERIRSEVKGVARVVYDLTPSNHYGEME